MKAWINKLGGVLLASLLTVMLNGKAYADLDPAPEEPKTEVVEQNAPVAAPVAEAPIENPVEAAPPVVETAPIPEAPPVVEAAPAPVAPSVVEAAQEVMVPAADPVAEAVQEASAPAAEPVDEPAATALNEAAPDAGPVVVESAAPAAEPAVTEETIPDAVPAVADADVGGMTVPEEESEIVALTMDTAVPKMNLPRRALTAVPEKTEPEADDSDGEAADETLVSMRKLPAEPLSVAADSEPAAVEEDPAEPDALPELSVALRTAPLAKSAEDKNSEAPSGILRKLDDGTYIMVGYQDDSAAISTESPVLTVLAAGLNKISSLSSGGSINIGGTGILLVDSLQYGSGGSLNLMPNTEQYGESGGSVALFCKQDGTEKDYVFVNGAVPGLLDEAYTLEGCNLILPSGANLILSSIGKATNNDTNEVIYYSGYMDDSDPLTEYDKYTYDEETAASLTIGRDASLVVNSGATVISIATTELSHRMNTTKIPPSLTVTENGNLTVDGKLDSSVLTVNQDASLRGSGTVSSDWMTIKSVSCLKNSDVTIQSVLCTIEGSGTIDTLKLNNAEIRLNSGESGVVINNVISSSSAGNESSLSCATGMTLGTISISGTLTLRSVSFYGDETVTSTLSGAVTGGTLLLDSGIYQLNTGFSCTSTQDYGHVIVYDYVGNSDCLTAPLLVAPSKAKAALDAVKSGQNEDGTLYYDVPIVVVSASQSYRLNGGVFTMEGFEATSADTSLRITTDKEGIALQDFHRGFQHTITENTTELVYELEYFDESKIFHTVILKEDDISKLDESFNPGFPLKNLYLIRVTKLTTDGSGQGGGTATSTSTSYTGSGVLGGTGAGSITIGGITYDLSSAKDYDPTPDPGPAPNPDPSPDPGPLPKPDPTPEPDPKPDPLVVTIEEAPVETPLVWAEVAPAVSNDAVSPTETQYVVLALEGEKTLKELGGRATVLMSYTPPAEYAGKPLFVVFRNEDGTLTAIRATYSNITGLLRFITDRLGTFMVVGFNFDGEEFSEEFYEALSRLTVLEKLEFAEYSQI